MAKYIIENYNNSHEVYGKKYILRIRDYNDIYLM